MPSASSHLSRESTEDVAETDCALGHAQNRNHDDGSIFQVRRRSHVTQRVQSHKRRFVAKLFRVRRCRNQRAFEKWRVSFPSCLGALQTLSRVHVGCKESQLATSRVLWRLRRMDASGYSGVSLFLPPVEWSRSNPRRIAVCDISLHVSGC